MPHTIPTNENVSSRYGAPMGRGKFTPVRPEFTARLCKVPLDSGGYDKGGAYWGHGKPLYVAFTDDFEDYTRAYSREEAADAIRDQNRGFKIRFRGIPSEVLA